MSTFRHCCESMRIACDDLDSPVIFKAKFREYGIRILDGGTSSLAIAFCPWSGDKLPESLRDEWFRRLEAQGIDPGEDPVPLEFQTEEWYSN